MMKKFALILAMSLSIPALSQVINCPSGFSSSGSCGTSFIGGGGQPWAVVGSNGATTPSLSGSSVELIQVPPGGHLALSLIYQTAVNVQAFATTYTFTANGHNIAFVLNNTSNTDGNGYPFDSKNFNAGAGCEGGFFQAFPGPGPNNVFALNLDSGNAITNGAGFTYSNAQIYQEQQDPCNPTNTGGYFTTKASTSPVPLNNPASTALTTTGHNYSATISYDGANLNLCLYDVTAANGSCSSGTSGTGTFFQKTWTGINIPSIVGMNTAYAGLVSGDNSDAPASLLINSFVYTVNTPPSTPTLSTYTSTAASGAAFATSPVFSPAAGTYSGAQSVTISNSTGGSYFCYILSSSVPTIFPWPDSLGGCTVGTKYTGAISVPSTQTLYAVAGTGLTVSLPSSQVAGTYTIRAGTTYNVNSGMSEATIQSTINTGIAGDTISFAAGTYNLASNGGNPNNASLNLKAGLFYTGPASGAPAILAGTGLYPLMYFNGTSANIQHLTFDNGILFLEDHDTSVIVNNDTFQNMPVCNTTASQTTAIFINGGINNSDISFNAFSHIGDNCNAIQNDSQGAGGIGLFAFHNLTITHNTFDHVHEGIDVPISTGGSYDCAGGVFDYNTFTNGHRMGIELLGTSSKPSGLEVAFNNFSLPLNPYFPSFGFSLTAGASMIFHDNVSNSNSGTTGPYGVEIAGIGTQAYNNVVEGGWAAGFSIGNTTAISITNNNICGPNMNANPSSGTTPSVGNANGFISWQGSAGAGPNTFTGNTTSSSSTCGSTTVSTPTFSPVAGTYTGAQSVAISTSTSGASIVYTNDGSTPTVTSSTCTITHGTLYTGAVSVSTSQTLKAIGCKAGSTASSAATAAYTIAGPVTLTTTQPPYGWLVMPGAARTPIFYPAGSGATTKLLNYSVIGGATLSCTSNCLPEVTVTMPSSGGTCSVSGSVGSYVLTSTVRPVVTATSVDNPSVSVTVPFNVCNTTVDAFAVVEPAYQQAYQGQKKTLQSYVVGYTNQAVTWAITTAPGGGDATLSDTGNRDVIFSSGTVSGRYVITATSVANGAIAGTAIIYVSPNSLPAYSVTPNKTQPTECYVDPALTGTDYEVGSGQAYADLTALPLSSTWTAGSIVRIHPGTYANWMAIQGTGTATQPIVICGSADGSGNLPVIDGFNATANASTPTVLNGLGGFSLIATSSGFGQGYSLGSVGPDYVTISGLEIKRFNYPYSYHAVPSGTLTPYGATGDSASGIWIGTGQRIHMEGLDLEDDGWGVLANNNTGGIGTNNGRRFTAFHQFMGGHINNFSQPGSFSNHGLYMEGIYSLVERNLFENPQYNLSDPTAPLYDNGDFIKMRGGASIIRYNMFRGILTGPAVWYPDMEDTVAFVDIASQLGAPGVANCSLSTWCTYTSNNITLTQLAENQETLAKDYFYGNVVSNEAGNQAIALLTYGSYSAAQECSDIGYWCTPGIDRGGQLYAWSNTFDQPSNWNNGNDSGVFLTANPFTSNYIAAAMPVQPTIFAANNVWWNDTACGGACFPFTVNVDATMIAAFQTNMSAAGALPSSGTITGGTTTGWGGYTNSFSFPLANPMQTHLSGLTSGNFKTTSSIPYNRTTFAPVASSSLINAGSQITLAEIAAMPVRFQPLNTGGVTARTDSASSTPTIGAVQTGSLPTFTAAFSPSPLTIPSANIGQQIFMQGSASFSDGTSSFIQFRSQPFTSSNSSAITFFGTGLAGNVLANGSGIVTTGFGGLAPSVSFTVGATPTVANPTYSPTAGTYTGPQSVAISTTTPSASVVYTADGTTPTVTSLTCTITNGTLYTGSLSVSSSQTLKALGCLSGDTASSVVSAAYVITVAAPTFSPPAGTYGSSQSITISTSTSGASLIYTNDGSSPTVSSGCTITHGTLYSGAITVATSQTVKAIGCKTGDTASSIAAAAYTIGTPPPPTGFKGAVGFLGTSTTF